MYEKSPSRLPQTTIQSPGSEKYPIPLPSTSKQKSHHPEGNPYQVALPFVQVVWLEYSNTIFKVLPKKQAPGCKPFENT